MTVVWGYGRTPNEVMLVGEAPGQEEANKGIPFVGKSGREQETYLSRHGLTATVWYKTNVVKEFRKGNPDPTPEQIEEWSPILEDEIEDCRPKLILSVGRFATRWFLGDVEMEAVHGLPHRSDRAPNAWVVPCYHPAFGFHNNDARALIAYDYDQAAATLEKIRHKDPIGRPQDEYLGQEDYLDLTGEELERAIAGYMGPIGMDTEGTLSDPWSIQVSIKPGTGFALRFEQPDFERGIDALVAQTASGGSRIIMHNAMYDMAMARNMGWELERADIWDSQYAAYLMRLQPQGLKPLIYRWCGMIQKSYSETVKDAGIDRQVEYITRAFLDEWPDPEPQLKYNNDGTAKIYTPWSITRRAESILTDYGTDKRNAKGEPVDVQDRWSKLDPALKKQVEARYGPMKDSGLYDLPLEEAVYYSARDADAALRIYQVLEPVLKQEGLDKLMAEGMGVLPILEQMQWNGMPASRSYFESLRDEMRLDMDRIQSYVSHHFYQDKPFNPKSDDQVRAIMRRRGLKGEKKTEGGLVSTSKKSIEHLREVDDAIDKIFDYREREKVWSTFCIPILRKMDEESEEDVQDIHCQILNTRVHTRRLATKSPNFLGMPSRSDLGMRVRKGFQAPDGYTFGGWDLSQVEVRYAAHETQDPLLIERIIGGLDLHRYTAAGIFGKDPDDVTSDERTAAKAVTFGVLYGIGYMGLGDQLRQYGCSGWDDEGYCRNLINGFFKIYVGVDSYKEWCKDEVRKTGIVRDVWGMPRYLPGVWATDQRVRAECERVAFSHRVQGGAQGLIQRSMEWLKPEIWALQDAGIDVQWKLQIHDEVIFMFPEDLWETMDELVREALTQHCGMELSVPLDADGHMSKSWGGLK